MDGCAEKKKQILEKHLKYGYFERKSGKGAMKKKIKDYDYTHEELRQIALLTDRDYIEGLGMATNNTNSHQSIQVDILQNYLIKFGRRDILTETRLSDAIRITPDVSIWEKIERKGSITITKNPLLIIEITHNTRNDRYSEKNIYAVFKYFPSVQESFIYNYETNAWTRYRRVESCVEKETDKDYSRVLGCYLHTLL